MLRKEKTFEESQIRALFMLRLPRKYNVLPNNQGFAKVFTFFKINT